MAHLRHRLLLALALLFVCPLPVVAFEILELNGGSISWTSDNPSFALVNITGPRIAISTEEQQVHFGPHFRCTVPTHGSGLSSRHGSSGWWIRRRQRFRRGNRNSRRCSAHSRQLAI